MDWTRKSPGCVGALAEAIDQERTKYTATNKPETTADFEIVGEPLALLPPGKYQASFVGWWTGIMFTRQPKIALNFKILTLGEHFGKTVSRWYNAKRLIGKHGTSGHFQIGRRSDFLADYTRFVAMPARPDRVSMMPLRRLVLLVDVGTVEVNRKQRPVAESLRYSVIRDLIRIEAGA